MRFSCKGHIRPLRLCETHKGLKYGLLGPIFKKIQGTTPGPPSHNFACFLRPCSCCDTRHIRDLAKVATNKCYFSSRAMPERTRLMTVSSARSAREPIANYLNRMKDPSLRVILNGREKQQQLRSVQVTFSEEEM